MVMMKNKRKAGVPMEKQRMFKMSQLEQDMLVKALCDTQNDVQPEQAEEMRSLAAKTVRAPRRRLGTGPKPEAQRLSVGRTEQRGV